MSPAPEPAIIMLNVVVGCLFLLGCSYVGIAGARMLAGGTRHRYGSRFEVNRP